MAPWRPLGAFAVVSLLFALSSCDNGPASSAPTTNTCSSSNLALTDAVTFNGSIKGVIAANCVSCHGGGVDNQSPKLTTVDSIVKAQAAIVAAAAAGRMPLNGSLPQATKDMMVQWQTAGFPLDSASNSGGTGGSQVIAGNQDTLLASSADAAASTGGDSAGSSCKKKSTAKGSASAK